jgi:hypothetical protein
MWNYARLAFQNVYYLIWNTFFSSRFPGTHFGTKVRKSDVCLHIAQVNWEGSEW